MKSAKSAFGLLLKSFLVTGTLSLALTIALQPAFGNTFPSLGTASNYGVLGLAGSETITNSLVTINGNEGISQGGSISNMAPSKVIGNVYEFAAGQYSGPGTVTGSVIVNPSLLTQNDTDVANALTTISADLASPNQTFGSISSATTVNASGPLTVVDVNGNITSSLTLNGTSSDFFVVGVTGNLALGGSDLLGLSGGITPDHVIYDFTGASGSISTHVGNVVNGILISQNLGMTLDGIFNGELIGGANITLMSGAVVNGAVVPEPKTVTLLGIMLVGIAFLAHRRKRFAQV